MVVKPQQVYNYKVTKTNKHSIQFSLADAKPTGNILRDIVRIEYFQGFSNGKGFQYYFTPMSGNTWSASPRLTGMFPTTSPNVYYGDIREGFKKTLIMFKWSPVDTALTVYQFPVGAYPMPSEINQIARSL